MVDFITQNAEPAIVINGKLCTIEAAQNGYALTAPAGNIQRFDLRYGDSAPEKVSDLAGGRHRSELSNFANRFTNGVGIWVSFSFRIEENAGITTSGNFTVFGQFHGVDPVVDRSPALALNISPPGGGKLQVWTTSAATGSGNLQTRYLSPSPLAPDQWYRIVVHMMTGEVGALEIWLDGTQIIDYSGPIGYYTDELPQIWWKYGVYAGNVAGRSVMEFANMEWGTSDLSARILSPLPR